MATPVVLEYSNRSMQRLGFLKHLVGRCSARFTTHPETVGRDLIDAAQRRLSVPVDPGISVYIKRRLQDRVYKDLRDKLEGIEHEGESSATIEIEVQDAYLADVGLPSHTGKLIAKNWREYPLLPVALGLVRKDSYALLVRGQTMLALCSSEELGGLRNGSLATNPLMLSPAQCLFFLYSILERDGDVLMPLLRDLVGARGVFRDWEAGDRLPPIFRQLAREYRNQAASAAERELVQSLAGMAESIERKAGTRYASGKGAREERITPRLEPLVDVGLLTKPDPYTFGYTFNEYQRAFATQLVAAESFRQFLEASFFGAWTGAFYKDSLHEGNEERLLQGVMAAWDELRSHLGYAPITDTILLGAIRHLMATNRYFEIVEGEALLGRLQKQAPNWLRFNIDRRGNLRYLKFDGSPPDDLDLHRGTSPT